MSGFKWVYTEKVKDHFMNPRNILEQPDTYEDDGKGMVGNPKCGDQMLMVIQVNKENETIKDCKWKTYGCASAIASTSVLSEMVIGKTLDQAFSITPKQVAKELGELPDHKVHCSVLGDQALRAAINDYLKRSGQEDKVREEQAKVICQCMSVTDHDIDHAVLEGARDITKLQEMTKLGTVCGQCLEEAGKIMQESIERHFSKD